MLLFRSLWFLFFNLMLVASCWSSVESPEQKAHRNARLSVNGLYFSFVFAEENKRLLEAIMVSVRQVYDYYYQDLWSEGHSATENRTEARQQLLTNLIQQAIRHTTSKVIGSEKVVDSHPDCCMFHLLQAFSNAPAMEESGDVVHWYRTRPVLLQGVVAEDRMDSTESLIQEAVQNSFREFPSNPVSREQLARQLGFIVVEMQELFLRGKALRSLSHRVNRFKRIPEIASDPSFAFFLSFLTERFNSHDTLWHTESGGSKWRQYQGDLSALFMKAADHEDYGIEWYQQIRRVLDGEKPVIEEPFGADNDWEHWIKPVIMIPFSLVVIFTVVSIVKEICEPEPPRRRAKRG
ncbi:hypothetical protein [Endozoicomonas sp. ALC020]|uniref:hypothetical protein n=1 Tax=unclassified Endozoicomonas TaxID=2644528 RepID=UPI003BB0246E